MTEHDLKIRIAAAVTTLAEVDGAPESTFYMALTNMHMRDWELIRECLLRANLVTIKGNYVRITDKGRELATAINQAIPPRE